MLTLLAGQNVSDECSLKMLPQRTATLLALTQPCRSVHLTKLDLMGYRNTPEDPVIQPSSLAKQSRQGKDLKQFFFPRFSEITKILPGIIFGTLCEGITTSAGGTFTVVHIIHQATPTCHLFNDCTVAEGGNS